MSEIVILRGIPGSGKSTLADEYVKNGYKRINKDDIRKMLNNYSMDQADEDIIHSVQDAILTRLMRREHDIVIDNTHTKTKYVKDLMSTIKDRCDTMGLDYDVHIRVLFTPLVECKRRNLLRERVVPEDVIDRMYLQLYNSGIEDKRLKASEWPTLIN